MISNKNYFLFFVLILIVLVNKNISAAPLCLEEETTETKIVSSKKLPSKNTNSTANENNNLKKNDNKENDEKEIEISADNKIELDNEEGIIIITGNAFVKEGLTSLRADMLTAFSCETKNGDTKILQINADNNVVIISDQGEASSKRAIYFVENKIIELYENVKLQKEGDILFGDKGVFNVLTGKGEISTEPDQKGSKRKVYGIIRSKKE